MKIKDLRNLNKEELTAKGKGLREELFKLNQGRYTGHVEKPHLFKIIRKDIARIETLIRETSRGERQTGK